jgi:hypothetical protein
LIDRVGSPAFGSTHNILQLFIGPRLTSDIYDAKSNYEK